MNNHGVANADVFAFNFALVVQGGSLHGTAGHQYRLQDRERRGSTGPANADLNVFELSGSLLGCKFVRHSSARRLAYHAQPIKGGTIVNGNYQPVGAVRQIFAFFLPFVGKSHNLIHALCHNAVGFDRQTQISRQLVLAGVGGNARNITGNPVHHEAQVALGH